MLPESAFSTDNKPSSNLCQAPQNLKILSILLLISLALNQSADIIIGWKPMKTILYIIAGPLFLIAIAAHIYVKIKLPPKYDSDLDDYYHEFEDSHPELAKYEKWAKITFTAAAIAALLLFIATAI